ncbi:MAG: hypothetical protein KDD69_01285 [Bdellovibrionales bacterium]|nr:hypothetical protein [Bdellovibrionales bacterium]
MENHSASEQKPLTRDEVQAYLADIEEKVINSDGAYMHSVIALNQLMRLPHANEVLDEKLKEQMHDLWIKLKSLGVQLSDPPLLFGLPANFGHESEEIPIDNDPEIEIKRHDPEEESGKRKPTRKGGNGGSSSSDEYSA